MGNMDGLRVSRTFSIHGQGTLEVDESTKVSGWVRGRCLQTERDGSLSIE